MGMKRRMRGKPVTREVLDRHNRHRQETFPEIPRREKENWRRQARELAEEEQEQAA
jgi:hypothetical protein